MYQIYLSTYFQRAKFRGWFICEIGLYASIYRNTYVQVVLEPQIYCTIKIDG